VDPGAGRAGIEPRFLGRPYRTDISTDLIIIIIIIINIRRWGRIPFRPADGTEQRSASLKKHRGSQE
jgi:hypothetical protein